MSFNNKHCLLFLVIFMMLLFGVSIASATDVTDVNHTQEITDDIKLSTPDNYDVDKVVQSSTSQSSTDAEVKNYNTSDKTNYSEISEITNRQTENAIKTNEINITSKNTNLNKNIQQKVKSEGEGSFTELQRLINENSVIELSQNYQFISGTDDDELVDGIVINKDLTIYGNGFTIDAKNSARIFKISGTDINVELINIKLINANSTLRDNDGNGGAIYTDSHLTIQDCTFINNGANNGGAVFATKQSDAEYVDSLTIDNCNFTENIALVNGGAINIFEESDNVKMLNSNFTNNRVIGYNNSDNSRWYGDGGAICFNKTSTNALIDNSIFINNTVNANGGAIMWKGEYGNITNSKFYNNSAPYAAGALRLDGSHVVVNNTLFDGNYDSKGNYSWGSAIYLTGNYTNITYSNFTNNYNSNNGTIAISGSNEMLENNIFINNSAYNGGAVYIRKNENVTFDYNTFTKNNAGNNGGAVFISDHANNTKILNSIFTDNKAIGYNISATNWIGNGGAVFFDTGCHEGLIDNSTFTNNSANANGGAVMWNGNDGNITSSKFYNNSAPYAGGALRLSGNRLLVNDSVFEGNYDPVGSNSWGSAVYISGNFCNITYSNFTNNYGGETAGAIYVAGTNATVKYSLFENNSANDKGGAINIRGNNAILFNNNITANKVTAGDGGAVYIQGANTRIEYCNIANNNATVHGGAVYSNGNNLTMDYCNLTSNSVCNVTLNTLSQGGAMYLASSHNARVNYCNFTSNYASNAGGAMFWVSSNNIIMNNSYFFNCSCGITNGSKATSPADHGGAINFNSNKNNTVNNCTFDSCFSEKDGGAIFYAASDSSGSVISNSTFINCYSVFRSAGAVAWKEKNGQILDTKFINCYSLSGDSPTFSGKGGAMYFEKAKNNILLNVSFINCSALYEGAAIYYRNTDNDPSSNNTHINCTFINNNVTRNGGALAFASANETYDGCIFVNNSASNGGSICYSVNGGIIIRNSIFVNNTNITNGGFIYINGSNAVILNNTFNNGSAENGGAIYVNTAVTINDSSFTNNTAENGGALYITKDTTLNNCNVTNNNATKGSGIYVNSGKLTLKKVKLIENQANAKEFLDISDNVIGDKRSISGVFTGWDNYLNGIYVVTDNVVFEDVLYLGIDNLGTVAIVNTDETSATIHNLLNESAQLIYLDIYGRDGSVQTLQNYTDEYGNFKFEFDNNPDDSYKIYHFEDDYYTELVYTFNKNLVNITVNVTNITYGNSESIKINVTGNASEKPTGTVLVYLNSTLDGFTNRTYEATLEDGFVIIDDAPLDLLNVSTYDVYVRYIGDEYYLSGNATATFVVSNAKPSLNIGISDYTYNETKTIIFDLIGINDEPITGKVIFNITGTESDGTPYSLTDIEINITRDEHGVIVNNTYELPVLNATGVDNNYEIVAFSPESTNYNSTNNSTTFKVFKAQPVINVTAYNITTDGMFAVDVHVEPEIANGTVNLFINTTEGKEYVLTLDDSRASIDLDKLPRGNYTVTATYNGDKNHNYPVSNSTKFEVLYDDFPIDIQLNNMTYGETQIISISVPKDFEGTLKIIFNGTELTDEYYTIEDGVIYIDTEDLTNVVEDGILIVGEYNLSVNYTPAENDYYRANCTYKLFNVTRAEPNIIITTEEIGYLSNETITINLTSYNATGKINITVVNITEEGSTYTNYSVDINNDTVVTVTIPDLEIGTYNVIVEYCNDTNYNNKTFTETFKVLPLVISITLNRPEIYVDEFETIFGSVTDISGRKVTTGKVNVTISNESGYITSYLVDVDSENGLYFTTNRYSIEGTLYANATYLLGDKIIANSTTKSFVVSKIPTITNVTVVNSTVGKVTIDVSVRENATPTATSSGYTNPITEGKLNVTVNGESKLFDITGSTTPIVLDVDPVNINTTETVDFTVEYIGDYKHNSSFGVNNTTGEKITEFTASPIGSNLTINVVPNPVQTGENVTISGQVFDDLGNLIKSGKVNVSIDGVFQGEYEINETTGYYTLNYTTTTVKDVNVEVNFTGIKTADDSRYIVSTSTNASTFTVEKIPTITNVTVTNHTVGNVTLKITVEDENGNIIKDGKVNITIAGNTPIEVELSGEDYTVVYLLDNMTNVGNISVTVEYTGNDTYLPSVANNTDDNKVLKNITVTPRNSSITVDVTPKNTTIGENVTISGQLVDEMGNNISNADLVIYVDGIGFAAKTNATGGYSFNYTTTRVADDIVVNATFDGGDNYNSTSANTTFNVTKIVTKTNVTIVNTTIGNVVIHVKVTNLTDYPVERGHVVVLNQTGQIVGEGELVNGGVDITLNVTTVGNIKVNVTYQENDIYYGSNATNSSLSDDHPEINITNIDVVKQEAAISIGLNPEVLIVGENVYIRGTVSVGENFITEGKVNVTVNGTNTTVDINSDGSYNLTFTAVAAGEYTVNATYHGNENISNVTSANVGFTVNKMPTNTTVSLVNNTIGHVVIEVSVTNNTGSPISGKINVTFADGRIIEEELDIDGKVNVTIPSDTMDSLEVNVTYLENDNYYSSVATNTSEGVNPDKVNTTVIGIAKLNSTILVDLNATSLTIGESVKIIVNITDSDGNQITDVDDVVIYIDGVEVVNMDDITIVDGNLTLSNVTVSAGTFTVNATYKGNDSVNGANSTSVQYTVDRIPTSTNVTIVNNTAANVTVNITVEDKYGNIIKDGKVNITIAGNTPIEVELSGENYTIVNLHDNITTAGDTRVTIEYTGNETYMPSIANITESEVLENITVANITSLLTVDVNESDVVNESSLTIYGTLTDDMGNNITDAYVTVYVNGERVDTVKTNSTGGYSVTYTADNVGINDVEATYDGDNIRYSNATAITSFNVIKLNTTVNVDVADITFGELESVNITINESDATGSVTVYVNSTLEGFVNQTHVLPLTDAEAQLNLSDLLAGKYNVTVIYPGDARYNANNTTVEFSVNRLTSFDVNITAMNITYGEDETITVILPEDATGSVTIAIDGITIAEDTKELEGGVAEFSIPKYTGLAAGDYVVQVTYSGDDNYASKEDLSAQFKVSKAESHINITAGNVRADEIATAVLNVSDYNATGKAVVTLLDSNNEQVGEAITVDPMSSLENETVSFGKLLPGDYTVNVTYYDDDNYNDSKILAAFTVDKIPTVTEVTILNNTAGNVTIDIKVTGEDSNTTMTGTVNITVNGKIIPVELTGTANRTVKLDIANSGDNYVTVEFTGNDRYLPSMGNNTYDNSQLRNITVDSQAVHITVEVIPEVYVDENVSISGTLTNDIGEKLANTDIILNIDGVNYTTRTDDNGNYEYVYNATRVGNITVNATFKANVTYDEASNTTSFNASKLPTNTTVSIVNSTIGNVTISVDVKDVYGHPVVNGTVIVYDKEHQNMIANASVINGKTGEFEVPADEVGDFELIVEYQEDVKYLASSAANNTQTHGDNITYINVTKQNTAITIHIVKDNVTIGETVVIYGVVTDGMGKVIPTGNITVLINGTEFNTTVTDGEYRLDNITVQAGVFDVNATFTGNANVSNVTSKTVNFTVNKIPTVTTITIVNNTAGNVTIEVSVTNGTQSPVSTGNIIVELADGTLIADEMLTDGRVNVTIPSDNTDTIKVNVTYNENTYYLESNSTKDIDVVKQNASITIDLRNTSVFMGDTVTITGQVFDGMGNLVTSGDVDVTVDGLVIPTTIRDGNFTINNATSTAGIYKVNATYKGNDTVGMVTSETLSFTVNKMPTIVTITPISDVEVNKEFTIEVTLTNQTGSPISGKDIIITVNDVPVSGVSKTDDEGKTNISYTPRDNSDLIIKAIYLPTQEEIYSGNETETTLKVDMSQSTLTVKVDKTDYYAGEKVTISGKLVDGQNNKIVEQPVTIYVNGNPIHTYTNQTGEYSYNINNAQYGEYRVQAVYDGITNAIAGDSDSTSYTVHKMPTKLNITIPEHAEVDIPFDIEVTLSNDTSNTNGIGDKTVVITVNDVPIKNVLLTNETGKIVVSYTPQDNSTLVVQAVFSEDDYYLESDNEDTILGSNIDLVESNITVDVNKSSLYAGESINITGKLVDGANNAIVDAVVKLYINDTFESIVLTNATGEFSYAIDNLAKGEYTVKAVYAGEANRIEGNEDTKAYVVDKMPTNVELAVPESVEVFESFDIVVTLTNNTDNTNAIGGKVIVITVNGEEIAKETTGTDGKVTVSYTPQNNTELEIRAVFEEDDYYLGNEDVETIPTANISLSQSTISVDLNESILYVDESVEVTGRLTDAQNNPIAGADVKVYIDDVLKTTVKTNSDGEYSYTKDNLNKGSYEVKVVYEGLDNVISPSNDTKSYVVQLIPTKTEVSVINATFGNVTIDVVVTENLTDRHEDVITAGCIEVTVNGKTSQYPVVGSHTTIKLDKNAFINTTDEVTFNVKYVQNDKYISSNGLNSTTGEEITTFNALSQQSTITVEVDPESQVIDDKVIISGHVYDGMGNEITSGKVYISINNDSPVEVNLTEDGYSYEYTAEIAGINNVTAEFKDVLTQNDNVLIKSSNDNTTFTVGKIATETIVQVTNNTVGNVTIDVQVKDKDGNPITDGELEVTVAGKTTTETITGETTSIKLDIDDVGDTQVSVKYLGNDTYLNSTGLNNDTLPSEDVFENITSIKQLATITVNAQPDNVTIGESVSITGKLTDGMNNTVADAYIEITLNGDRYITTTDSNGEYTLTNVTIKKDTVDVVATYKGNKTLNATSAITDFTVNKIPTTTLVSIANNTAGNVSIDVIVKDNNGSVITSGKLNITTEDDTFTVDISGEITNIPLDYTTNGTKDISVTYIENDVYEGSAGLDKVSYDIDPENAEIFNNITVIKQNTTITVTTITPVKVGNSTIISGKLVDEQSRPISGAKVVVIIDDENYIVTTNADGEYSLVYNDTIVGTHNVTSIYNSNDTFIGSNDTTNFEVEKRDAKISINEVEDVPVGNDLNIIGKLEDEYGEVIKGVQLNVTFDGQTQTVTTDSEGNFNASFPTTNVGTKDIKIEFNTNENYTETSLNDTVNIVPIKASITIDTPTDVEAGEPVNITGSVTDEDGNPLSGVKVNVTVNGETKEVTTDADGKYTVPFDNIVPGQNNITATNDDDSYNIDDAKDKFFVPVLDTTITVDPIDDTLVGDDVVVSGVLLDENGKAIGGADVTVTVDGVNQTVVTDKDGRYEAVFPTSSVGTKLVTVEYMGNDKYDGAKESVEFDVYKDTGVITLDTPTGVEAGEPVNITGSVTDENGKPIANMPVNVTVNGETKEVTTDDDGKFSVPFDNVVPGQNNVTVVAGNDTTSVVPVEDKFFVPVLDTTITVDPIDDTLVGDDVVVSGVLLDENGKAIGGADVTVTVDGVNQTVVTDEDGHYEAVFPTSSVGTKLVTVEFMGDDKYDGAKESVEFDVYKDTGVITLDTPTGVEAGEPVNITGSVTDEDGNPLSGVKVNVTVNGETKEVTTDDDGKFSVPFDNVVPGQNNVTVVAGNDTTGIVPVEDKFFVPVLDTTISVDPIDDTLVGDDVVVSGVLLDENGKAIGGADVTVTVDGVNQTVVTDEDGHYEASFPTSSVGTKLVTVEYLGNDKYDGAREATTIDVYKDTGVITLDTPTGVEAGEPVNITGSVTDEDGNPLSGVKVNVTVNGETKEVTTDDDGKFSVPFDNVVPGQNNVTVVAGNDTTSVVPVEDKFFVPVLDTTITVDPIDDTLVGDDVVVSGVLLDENGKAIGGADVTVTVDGVNQTVVTDEDGHYEASFPTSSVGTKLVTVEFMGNDKYDGAREATTFDVYKDTANITVELPENAKAGESADITGSVNDKEGNPIANMPVNVTVNGKTYPTMTDENGNYIVTVDDLLPGQYNVTVSSGNYSTEINPVDGTFTVSKLDDEITIDDPTDIPVGKDVTIEGRLLDENNNPIADAEVTVTFDGINQTVITDSEGYYSATFPTTSVGTKVVKAEYAGNEIYNSANKDTNINIVPNKGTIALEVPNDAVVGKSTTVNGTLTNQDGEVVANTPVKVTVNGDEYSATTDENGRFTIVVDNVVNGTNNVTASAGNENITVEDAADSFNGFEHESILSIDPIDDVKVGANVTITGKLTDEQGNPISDAFVTVTVDGEDFYVTTDEDGCYEILVPDVREGFKEVTASYESEQYSPSHVDTNFTVDKKNVTVTVDPIKAYVGEDITLVAHLTDEYGNLVSGGNLVFKINDRTLRQDGRFDTDIDPPMKFKVYDGTVKFTIKAEQYLTGGVNVTASYSGSYQYEEVKGSYSDVDIRKRSAELTVKVVPNPVRQNTDTVFIVELKDVTPNATNKTCITTDAGLILKVNNITLNDSNGEKLYLDVNSTTVNYIYHIPTGMPGVYDGGDIRNYTVEAVYNNSMFIPGTRNTTTFNVERSIVNINYESVTLRNNEISVKATFTDYQDNLLVGVNKICVKINGKTYRENNETKYFYVHDGIVDLSGIKVEEGTDVKSITLVTGDRQPYLSARVTTTDITKT